MRKLCFQILLSAAVWVSLCGLAAAKGHGGDHGHGASADHGHGHDFGDHDRDRDRDHHFTDRDHHEAGPSKRPPGWDKGKKTGWGNCNEPPGLAKKNGGCGSRSHGHHDHDAHYAHHDTHHDTHHTTTTQTTTHHTWPWQHNSTTTATTTTHTTTSYGGRAGAVQRPTHVAPNVR